MERAARRAEEEKMLAKKNKKSSDGDGDGDVKKESNKQKEWEDNESPGKWDENGAWAAALRGGEEDEGGLKF